MATSTTIHFKANFKGKVGREVVPHCTRWALSPKFGQITEDKTQVNCTRCAKQLEIVAAPKQVSSTKGTCQCCFGGYETRAPGEGKRWYLVLHGYQRPGCGYIVGDCQGTKHVPYEVSCEQTKVFRQELVRILGHRNERLSDLENDRVLSLYTKVDTGKRIPSAKRGYGSEREYKTVEVKLGDKESQNPFQPEATWERVPSYATLQKAAINATQSEIRSIESNIAFLTGKIDSWKPVPFPLLTK